MPILIMVAAGIGLGIKVDQDQSGLVELAEVDSFAVLIESSLCRCGGSDG